MAGASDVLANEHGQAIAWLRHRVAELEAELKSERAARAKAEEALRLRDEFLSIAAHELKTPLTALLGYTQLALRRLPADGPVEPERAIETLRTIREQGDRLARLVNQLLDVSRIETGKLVVERERADLGELTRRVVEQARLRAADHQITLEAPASLGARIDPLRVEEVLGNLLDNAIKYSPDGGRVEVTLRAVDGWAELRVRDHGVGIPPERRGAIFERFYQAHDDGGARAGLGLGLFISRQIVDLHGGQIRAEFPPDGGTCFVVRLPLAG
jgi:signal transduction histidine kinase